MEGREGGKGGGRGEGGGGGRAEGENAYYETATQSKHLFSPGEAS